MTGPTVGTPGLHTPASLQMAYRAYGGEIFGYAVRSIRSREVAEEITQDVFVNAWRARASFDPSQASLRTWLFAITRNRITDEVRRADRRPRTAGTPAEADTIQPDHVNQVVTRMQLLDALDVLSPVHREVVQAVYLDGWTPTDYARHTGTKPGTVRRRLYDALHKLREHLAASDSAKDQL